MMDKEVKDEEGLKEISLDLHSYYRGKIEVVPKCPVRDLDDINIWYTPGVAEPCKEIHKDSIKSFDYSNRGNTIAVVSDGSRVLGLGDIGPEASLPVMEGKSLLFKFLGAVDAFPLSLDVRDEQKIISTVKNLSPSLGGVNLEDIESPKCFRILRRLRKELDIPVWHDDQQGTALVTIAGLIGGLRVVEKNIDNIKLVIVGTGAAGINITKYAIKSGVKPEKIVMVDSKGILNTERKDLDPSSYKYQWASKTNPGNESGDISNAMEEADVCIAASTPGPGVISEKDVKKMADDPIVFAEANPIPEINPVKAKEAGAKIVGTGRSDYPNQINNSLGFPGVFRGALEVGARKISDEMCISAAKAIAERAEEIGLNENFIIPKMSDLETYVKEAVAVGEKAKDQGLARKNITKKEIEERARYKLKRSRTQNEILIENGVIKSPEED